MSPRIIEEILPANCAAGGKDDAHMIKKDLATGDRNALEALREDVSRQLGLMLDRHNSMLQSIGIIAALASVLFLQLIAVGPALYEKGGVLFMVSMGSILLCGIYGVVTISGSRAFALSAGLSIEEERDLYDILSTSSLEERITEGIFSSCEIASRSNTRLADRITHMTMLLLVGVLMIFIEWCIW